MARGKTNKSGLPPPKKIKNKEKYAPKNAEKAAAKKALRLAKRAKKAAGGDGKEDVAGEEESEEEEEEEDEENVVAKEVEVEIDEQEEGGDQEMEEEEVVVPEPSTSKKSKKSKSDPLPAELEIDTTLPAPLSKAALRLAKKTAASAGPTPASTSSAKEPEKPKKLKKQNSVWIGNLSYRTTALALRQFFEQNLKELAQTDEGVREALEGGRRKLERRDEKRAERVKERVERGEEVRGKKGEDKEEKERLGGMVTRVNLPLKKGRERMNENMGFAYVDLLTPELQSAALLLSERPLLARRLLIKLGTDHAPSTETRTPKPASIPATVKSLVEKGKEKNPESATLFMGNLGFETKEEDVRDLVEGNAGRFGETGVVVKNGGGEGGKRKREEEGSEDEDESESESEVEDEESKPAPAAVEEEGEEGAKKPMQRGGAKSGLKKVRLGQFEDTGRCKGFAFLDFKTPELATFALANPANHFLKGRKLVLQYASEAAAQRSGGPGSRRTNDSDGPNKRPRVDGDAGAGGEKAPLDYTRPSFSRDRAPHDREPAPARVRDPSDMRGKKWEVSGRPRPGAALAMAKRENVAIVAGAGGKKIVFDE